MFGAFGNQRVINGRVKWISPLLCLVLLLLPGCESALQKARVEVYARNVASLIEPEKLATLRERGANPRVQKYVAQLAEA